MGVERACCSKVFEQKYNFKIKITIFQLHLTNMCILRFWLLTRNNYDLVFFDLISYSCFKPYSQAGIYIISIRVETINSASSQSLEHAF